MARILLRQSSLSSKGEDVIDIPRDNAPSLPEKFGNPDLSNAAEVQASCEAWYPSTLEVGSLDGYVITTLGADIGFSPSGRAVEADAFRKRLVRDPRRPPRRRVIV